MPDRHGLESIQFSDAFGAENLFVSNIGCGFPVHLVASGFSASDVRFVTHKAVQNGGREGVRS